MKKCKHCGTVPFSKPSDKKFHASGACMLPNVGPSTLHDLRSSDYFEAIAKHFGVSFDELSQIDLPFSNINSILVPCISLPNEGIPLKEVKKNETSCNSTKKIQ